LTAWTPRRSLRTWQRTACFASPNADEVVGRDAIEAAIAGFFTTIKGISHNVVGQWDVDDTTIVQFEATYRRMDDRRVTVPAVTVYRRGGDLIDDYRIYVDLTPVYA
jgi:hypothetical protein